jgi:hypothetical protein
MFNKIIKDIEFKMIRNEDNCWIKIEPIKRKSTLTSLYIILNSIEHNFDIYDKNGLEAHKIYFKGYKITPSFYLTFGEKSFKVDCKIDGIKIMPITKTHDMKKYIEKNCSHTSLEASCWAVAVYYTSRPEKPPFDEM